MFLRTTWRITGGRTTGMQFSDEMAAWMQSLRAELDGITDTIQPERFLQTMAGAIADAGELRFPGYVL